MPFWLRPQTGQRSQQGLADPAELAELAELAEPPWLLVGTVLGRGEVWNSGKESTESHLKKNYFFYLFSIVMGSLPSGDGPLARGCPCQRFHFLDQKNFFLYWVSIAAFTN